MVKTIAKVGYAVYDEKTSSYGEVVQLESAEAGGRNFTAEPRGEVTEIYADGIVALATDNNDGYDIELELLDIIDDVEKDWYGMSINETTGAKAEFATGALMPKFCLMLLEEKIGSYQLTYYPMCQCSKRASKASKTSEGSFDPQFPTVSIAARPNDNKLVRYVTNEDKIPDELPAFPANAAANEGESTGL